MIVVENLFAQIVIWYKVFFTPNTCSSGIMLHNVLILLFCGNTCFSLVPFIEVVYNFFNIIDKIDDAFFSFRFPVLCTADFTNPVCANTTGYMFLQFTWF